MKTVNVEDLSTPLVQITVFRTGGWRNPFELSPPEPDEINSNVEQLVEPPVDPERPF